MKSKLSSFFTMLGCLSPVIGIALFIFLLIQLEIGKAFLYGFLSFIVMLVFAAIASNIDLKKREKHRISLYSMKPAHRDYHDSFSYVSYDLRSKITIDNINELLYIWKPKDQTVKTVDDVTPKMLYHVHTYSYEDILSVEHVEDGDILSKLSRQSQSAKFLLDGLPAYEVQPVTEKKSDNEVNLITLKITVNDKANPVNLIYFYINPSASLQKNLTEYKQIQSDLQRWLTAFHLMIKEADEKDGGFIANDRSGSVYEARNQQSEYGSISPSAPGSEHTAIVHARLLPLLKQIMHRKALKDPTNALRETPPPQTSSYFDELLKKNRELMQGKRED